MINARAEGIWDKPSFRHAIKTQRCLVPSTGYYEWKQEGKDKVPYLFRLKGDPMFSFAGRYEHWHDAEGIELETFTIITTSLNELAATVHDRMPAILRKEDEDEWIDPEVRDSTQIVRLLVPYASERMKCQPVSKRVGSVSNNDREVLAGVN